MTNYLDWLNKKGWDYKGPNGNGEVQIKTCVFCKDSSYHLYFNVNTGLFHCKQGDCHASGNYYMLLKHLGELKETTFLSKSKVELEETKLSLYHTDLLADEDTMQWLRKRKISQDAITYFMLGIANKNKHKVLVLPYFENNKLVGLHYKSLEDDSYWWEPYGKMILFNRDVLYTNIDKIIITEGEMDTLAIWSAGIRQVVSVPSGASTFKPEWVDDLDRVNRVFVCYDNDKAGREGATILAERFDYKEGKLFYVQLPQGIKDANAFFIKGGGRGDFEGILERARNFEVRNIVSYNTAVIEWKEKLMYGTGGVGIGTPWQPVNSKIKEGFKEGDSIVLSGLPGTGKTTFLLNWAWWLAYKQRIPTLFYCLEMSDERLLPRLGSHVLQKVNLTDGDIDIMMSLDAPLYFVRDYDFKHKGHHFLDLIRTVSKRYGVKVVMFDNLQFAITDDTNVTAQTTMLTKNFKLLAEELKVPIIVIHHLSKIEDETKSPTSKDLRDSGMARANADFVLILHRNRIAKEEDVIDDIFETRGTLTIDKTRYSGTGIIHLNYDGELATWRESSIGYQPNLLIEE